MRKPNRLRSLRRSRTLNQAEFARLLDVSQQTLSKFESGRLVPSVDVQARIAAILGVSRADLFPPDEQRRAS
jgi:putative transcriptional regulator